MTRSKLFARLARVAPPIINAIAKPGPHCVLSTAIGLDVLERCGVPAEPFPAAVRVCNAAFIAWADVDFAGGDAAQIARGAYLLTNEPNDREANDRPTLPSMNPPSGPPWEGHLAIRAGDRLIDLDLGNFNRPTKGIVLPPAFVAPFRPDGTVIAECTIGADVTYLRYAPLDGPHAEEYQRARDWLERDRYGDLVARIVKSIRRGAECVA